MARPPSLRSIVTVLATSLALVAFVIGSLVVIFDLRVERDGSGMRPIVSFGDADDHFEALEHNRSQHYSRHLPPPAPATDSDTEVGTPDVSVDTYWTDFRGPNRDGRYYQTPS